MKKLPKSVIARSKNYIWSYCNPLSQALYTHFLEKKNIAGVIKALSAFQNDDGGFGHNLEGDFELPDSSPIATSVAFQIMTLVDAGSDESMVQRGIQYLVHSYKPARKGWISVPPQVNNYPHADWWHYLTAEGGSVIDRNWGNPTAELVGYLMRYPQKVPTDMLETAYQNALGYLRGFGGTMEMHELYCFMRLAENMRPADFESVQVLLKGLVLKTVATNPEEWKAYSAQPLDFVQQPGSFLYQPLKQAVEANLDYWIETVQPDGSWQPAWSWDRFAESWQQAKVQVAGRMTVNRLNILNQFDRLE